MAAYSFSQNGASVSGGGNPKPTGGKRGKVCGWTPQTARSNTKFLQSIRPDELTGIGVAFSLTLRDIPANHVGWQKTVQKLLRWMRSQPGFIRGHWLTELQERGAPHLHGVLYVQTAGADNAQILGARLEAAWLRIAGEFRPGSGGQDVKPIDGPTGWLKYLAKHGARSVSHYQRSGMPPGWSGTGRLWGHVGEWPAAEWLSAELAWPQFWQVRRQTWRYLVAQARADALHYESRGEPIKAASAWHRLSYVRRMRKCPDRQLGVVLGLSGWVPLPVTLDLLEFVGWNGTMRGCVEEAA